MKRIHNANDLTLDLQRNYTQEIKAKPRGLWYAIDHEWLRWCAGEMPHWVKKYAHSLDVDTKDILIISDVSELYKFHKKYYKEWGIRWDKIAGEYKGIEIQNYYHLKNETRYGTDFLWLYGWDVPSGCIWDLSIVNDIHSEPTPNEYFTCDDYGAFIIDY